MAEIKLSISIMAYPTRAKYFTYFKEKLGDVPFAIDDGCGLIENFKKAWSLYDKTADYHCVLQDDAIIPDNFKDMAIKLVEMTKYCNVVYNFFTGAAKDSKEMKDTLVRGDCLFSPTVKWGVALCLPTERIDEMLGFIGKLNDKEDDERMTKWVKHAKMSVLFTIPCLVDHREGKSLVDFTPKNKNNSYRHAISWVGEKNNFYEN